MSWKKTGSRQDSSMSLAVNNIFANKVQPTRFLMPTVDVSANYQTMLENADVSANNGEMFYEASGNNIWAYEASGNLWNRVTSTDI